MQCKIIILIIHPSTLQETFYAIMCKQQLFEFSLGPFNIVTVAPHQYNMINGTPEKPMYNTIKRLIIILKCHQ